VLTNNAGAIFGMRRVTGDGCEMTFQVNHLAHFLLTNLLLPTLVASAPSRVISVSSGAHAAAWRGLPFDDLMLERGWRSFRAYANSKLANVLFAYELARRLEGTGVTSNAMHPGLVATGFGKQDTRVIGWFYDLTERFQLNSEQGASTEIYLASAPEVAQVTGKYYYESKPVASSRASMDAEAALRLWEVSARLAGISGEVGA
jgi:retinol dehydrogenase-14